MILPVLQYPDPRLARKAAPVDEIHLRIRELAADMAETMYARDGIGLAAPQIGEALRLVVLDISGPERREDLRVLVNPVLVLSGEEHDADEGCLSVPEYTAKVARREFAAVRATDLEGRPVAFDAAGRLAVCIQHECDHLDGVLFIDRLSRLKRDMLDRRLKKQATGHAR
jgi:peptide deformylase